MRKTLLTSAALLMTLAFYGNANAENSQYRPSESVTSPAAIHPSRVDQTAHSLQHPESRPQKMGNSCGYPGAPCT